jgi:hypothetical protein
VIRNSGDDADPDVGGYNTIRGAGITAGRDAIIGAGGYYTNPMMRTFLIQQAQTELICIMRMGDQ